MKIEQPTSFASDGRMICADGQTWRIDIEFHANPENYDYLEKFQEE